MEQKQCSQCKEVKPLDQFYWKSKKKGTRRYKCISCVKNYNKAHYINNKQDYLGRAKARNLEVRREVRDYVWKYLSNHECVDCGESNPLVLEFDHRDPKLKSFTIGREAQSYGVKRTIEEIQKCEVRCANCHKIRTAKQFGYWSDKLEGP